MLPSCVGWDQGPALPLPCPACWNQALGATSLWPWGSHASVQPCVLGLRLQSPMLLHPVPCAGIVILGFCATSAQPRIPGFPVASACPRVLGSSSVLPLMPNNVQSNSLQGSLMTCGESHKLNDTVPEVESGTRPGG